MYDDPFDDTMADSQHNYDDDHLMDDLQSNIVVDDDFPFEDDTNFGGGGDFPFEDDTNFDDDDDFPFVDDSQSNVNDLDDLLPSHESYPTRHTQFHPSTPTGHIQLASSSQMPPPFAPPRSRLSPDVIAQLTPAQLAHNPEFMRLQKRFEVVQNLVSALEREHENRRHQQHLQVIERVMEWRSEVHA